MANEMVFERKNHNVSILYFSNSVKYFVMMMTFYVGHCELSSALNNKRDGVVLTD